jgi:hypothetical protein
MFPIEWAVIGFLLGVLAVSASVHYVRTPKRTEFQLDVRIRVSSFTEAEEKE